MAATYSRVVAADDLPPTMGYAREAAPGLAEVLTLDLPETVLFFSHAYVETYDLPDLWRAGLAVLTRDVGRGRVTARPDGS